MISANRRRFTVFTGYFLCLALVLFTVGSCGVYSFKDVSIPPEIKTIRIGFIENRARFVDPLLSPQLTDMFKKKVSSQTKLIEVQNNADYDVSAYVSEYNVTTVGVSSSVSSINRLTVTIHLALKNRLNDQKLGTPDFETDISRNFDFGASLTLNEAQATLTPEIISQMTDDLFNRLFSNW